MTKRRTRAGDLTTADAVLVASVHARIRTELGDAVYFRYLAAMAAEEPAIRRRWRSASVDEVLAQIDGLEPR